MSFTVFCWLVGLLTLGNAYAVVDSARKNEMGWATYAGVCMMLPSYGLCLGTMLGSVHG